jgi:hypothetical protein
MPKDAPQSLKDVGDAMDRLSDAEAEFGTMGISSPVLAEPSSTFEFNVSANANEFYNDAKTSRQGSASILEQTITSIAAGLSAKIAPPALIGGLTTQPATQPTSMQDLINEAKAFNPPATQPALGITDRTALLTAAGDNAVNAMFQLLGNPDLASQFQDKRVLFGVSTVSVNPGWRTKEHYAANAAMIFKYQMEPARPEVVAQYVADASIPITLRASIADAYRVTPRPSDLPARGTTTKPDRDALKYYFVGDSGTPLVAAVSPLTDTQTLDLQSSFLDQEQLALNLMVQGLISGATVQANAAMNYLQSLQQNFDTVNADVVANAYSHGNLFGFQVGPSLRAIEKSNANQESGPAGVLARQSFPALIIVGFDASDVIPKVQYDHPDHYLLLEPCLLWESVDQWVPVDNDMVFGGPRKVLKESDKLGLSYSINHDRQALETTIQDSSDPDKSVLSKVTNLADARITTLKTEVFGDYAEVNLPAQVMLGNILPLISSVKPAQISQGQNTLISLTGSNLQNVMLDSSKIKVVSGAATIVTTRPATAPSFSGEQINLTVNVTQDPVVLQLQSTFGDPVYTPSITLDPKTVATTKPFASSLIVPDIVKLFSTGKDQYTAQDMTVLIAGENLDQVRLLPDGASGKLGITATQNGQSLKLTNLTLIGQSIRIDLSISTVGPIQFTLPAKNSDQADHQMLNVVPAGSKPLF